MATVRPLDLVAGGFAGAGRTGGSYFATYRRFEFTTLTYTLIALHMCVLFVGGHYTYARVPLFDWLRPIFRLASQPLRSPRPYHAGFCSRHRHARSVCSLAHPKRTSWQPFLVVCVCLAISALYELIEWWTALLSGDAAISFLGTQGDPWDTQEDMFCALLGAIAALALLSRVQDRAINRLTAPTSS